MYAHTHTYIHRGDTYTTIFISLYQKKQNKKRTTIQRRIGWDFNELHGHVVRTYGGGLVRKKGLLFDTNEREFLWLADRVL